VAGEAGEAGAANESIVLEEKREPLPSREREGKKGTEMQDREENAS
jgi:hypothetical protein